MNLVLDLDSTLISTKEDSIDENLESFSKHKFFTSNAQLRSRIYYFKIKKKFLWGIYRPYIKYFLRWADQNFENIIIWSAGTSVYVKNIVISLCDYADIKHPKIIYSRENCQEDDLGNKYKDLNYLFDSEEGKLNNINKTNTILIDDNLFTCSINPENSILIPAHEPCFELSEDNDIVLHDIINWFNSLPKIKKMDVRQLKKPTWS